MMSMITQEELAQASDTWKQMHLSIVITKQGVKMEDTFEATYINRNINNYEISNHPTIQMQTG